MFKRKIYDKLLQWKKDSDGKTALLIEGAWRANKSCPDTFTLTNAKAAIATVLIHFKIIIAILFFSLYLQVDF